MNDNNYDGYEFVEITYSVFSYDEVGETTFEWSPGKGELEWMEGSRGIYGRTVGFRLYIREQPVAPQEDSEGNTPEHGGSGRGGRRRNGATPLFLIV